MTAQQLKNSILQMAVQGKLVPQDPNDEPASVLLERIRAEKERLIREKKIKREKNPSIIFRGSDNIPYEKVGDAVTPLEVPFEIPESWEWVRLIDVCEYIQRGKSPKYSPIKKYPVIAQKCNQWTGFSIEKAQFIEPDSLASYGLERILQDNDLMWNSTGLGTLGRMAIYETEANPYGLAVADSHVTIIRPFKEFVLPEYLYFYFANPTVQSVIEDQADGTTKQKELATVTIKAYLTPIPPLEEQRRILAKLSEVLPVVQSYGEVHGESAAVQEVFPDRLKKSILQQAVQGKLVPQDPEDEPAEVLLERIWGEKQRLVREGKIKKDKHESIIFRRDNSHYELVDGVERCIDEELPFEIPESWYWTRLMDVCEYIQRGKSPKYSTIKKYPVIAQKCNQWSGFSIEKAQFIDPDSLASYGPDRILQENDLMWNSTGLGTLGRMAIYKATANPYGLAVADSHVTVIRPFKQFVLPEYLYFYFSNPTVQNMIEEQADGTTKQKELATATIKAYWTPIPPLNEQYRIVAKIKELLLLIQSI